MADRFEVTITNIDAIRLALKNYPEASKKYFSRAINAGLAIISQNAVDKNFQFKTPREQRTGLLALSFDLGKHQASEDNLKGTIGPTVEYAKWVEGGTPAHLIQAVNKKCLANQKAGLIFGRSVNHPGTQANPFMERIIKSAEPEINKTFDRALELVMATLKV
jgi:hypothetical protein